MIAATLAPTRTPVQRPHVTTEQIDHCHPTYDYQRHEWFYQVDSESDPLTDPYEVRYHSATDSYTCTCPCGAHAFISCRTHRYCKHVYWSCAHYQRSLRTTSPQANVAAVIDQPPQSDVACEDAWLNDTTPGKMHFHDWM